MRPNRWGFTLIELTVVLAIAAILLGMVIVRVDWGSPRQQTIREARKLGRLLCEAREKALTDQELYAVRFRNNSEYSLVKPAERSSPISTAQLLNEIHPLESISISNGSGAEQESVIVFSAHGVVNTGPLKVSHVAGFAVILSLDPILNEVSYEERWESR